jgi:kynurenine formamidase
MTEKRGNWGRWGTDDERGTLNLITPDVVRSAADTVRTGKVYPLSIPIQRTGTPAPEYRGTAQRLTLTNCSDEYMSRAAGGDPGVGANEDVFIFPAHTATHLDALAHVYADEQLYNGFRADEMSVYSGAPHCGIDKVGAIAGRGVLLDVAAAAGVPQIDDTHIITPDDLTAALDRQGTELRAGDLVLIRTGWMEAFLRGEREFAPQPGIGLAAAEFLASHDVGLVGADNSAVEAMPFDQGVYIGSHIILLVNSGIHLLENLHLAELAADGCTEFLLTIAPLRVTGATGSPVTPIAIA